MGQVVEGINDSTQGAYRAFESNNIFGGRYQKKADSDKGLGLASCIFCGRDTSKQGKSWGVFIGAGGSLIVHPDDYETKANDAGAMGWFPVGSECIKEVPFEFRLANIIDNKEKGSHE